MKLFYNCNFFEEKRVNNKFSVYQEELVLDSFVRDKAKFKKIKVNYDCFWKKSIFFDISRPCILIPIRDNIGLLRFTLQNLKNFEIIDNYNVIVIDDRSKEKIQNLLEEKVSYLRIDNRKGFNFSMLNNIAAKICYDLDCKIIILWNSDLWCKDSKTLGTILSKHNQHKATVSGTKLIYPPQSMSLDGEVDTKNIKTFFKSKLNGFWRETVQFGGDIYITDSFHHYGRFKNPKDYRINCDRPATFITGAFQVIDLEKFILLGGLNPSLSKNYQDNDFCFKTIEAGEKIYYFGKDSSFYHDESTTLIENKIDKQFKSDQVLFKKIWNNKIKDLL